MTLLDSAIQSDLLKELDRLSPTQQHRVLDFARALVERMRQGALSNALLQFIGSMSHTEAEDFLRGIEEECKRVT